MNTNFPTLVSDNLDIWTTAIERKSGAGRGSGKKVSLHGIERLRALILDLAVRGKLVPQRSEEEPAERALQRIVKARQQKLASGIARKPKVVDPLPTDLPLLPAGWAWTQLGTVAEVSPSNSASDDIEASFVPMAMISTSISGEHEMEIRKWGEIKKGFTQFAEGDIGLAKITPCFENGKAAIFQNLRNGIGAGTTELHVARPFGKDVNQRYLLLTMKTGTYLANGQKRMTGTAGQKRVTRAYFEASPLPLPPLAEQGRIVAKVDELMALCDKLETESVAALAAHQTLVDTLLATLVNSADATELSTNWKRLETHFDSLFTTEASIDALKLGIVQLAVKGKLTDAKEEWRHYALGEFVADASAGWSPQCIETPRSGDDWGVLKVSAVTWGRFQPEENKRLPANLVPKPEAEVAPGDFLISRANTAELVARSIVVPQGAPKHLMMSDKIIRLRFLAGITPEYVNLIHTSPETRAYYARVAGGTSSSMKNVSQSQIRALPIMVPSLAEQQKIVAKVDLLMALCENLKASLSEAVETQKHIADAIVGRSAA